MRWIKWASLIGALETLTHTIIKALAVYILNIHIQPAMCLHIQTPIHKHAILTFTLKTWFTLFLCDFKGSKDLCLFTFHTLGNRHMGKLCQAFIDLRKAEIHWCC